MSSDNARTNSDWCISSSRDLYICLRYSSSDLDVFRKKKEEDIHKFSSTSNCEKTLPSIAEGGVTNRRQVRISLIIAAL